ncbi:MAG TPA: S8 family serine peptidase [Rhodothermales bacterium]|jgi:endonuclease G
MADVTSGTSRPIAIYVEDEAEWRNAVYEFILRSGRVEFEAFICGSSIEEVEGELRSSEGPLVVIMDLRLGGEESSPDFGGYQWLVQELDDFMHRNASALVFVISGQLNGHIRDALRRKGIPDNHIYDKGDWAEERFQFVQVLRDELAQIGDIAHRNIIQGISGRRLDPALIQSFRTREAWTGRRGLPMLVQVHSDSWLPDSVVDLQLFQRVGSFIPCLGSEMTLVALEQDPEVIYVEPSRFAFGPKIADSIPLAHVGPRPGLAERGDAAAIAFIVDSIHILDPAFREESGNTRFLALWDQTDPTGTPPSKGLPGTLHSNEDLNRYLGSGELPNSLAGREKFYGNCTARIAAGGSTEEFAGGLAPDAKLIVVIPAVNTPPADPDGLGYTVSHLLALEFIRKTAQWHDLPVAVLLGFGSNAGAHDGSTLFERAIDAATCNGKEPGCVLVKSAGEETSRGGHARLSMESRRQETLRWQIEEPLPLSVLEVWFESTDKFSFRLIDPDAEASKFVNWLDKRAYGVFSSGNHYAMTYVRHHHNNGRSLLLVTLYGGFGKGTTPGIWSLEIRSDAETTNGTLDCWLERQSHTSTAFLDHLNDDATLTVPATAHYVVTVGSVLPSNPDQVSPFSSCGPTLDGRRKPDIAAPDASMASPLSERDLPRGGGSLAAAYVTGAIALALSARAKARLNDPALPQLDASAILEALPHVVQEPGVAWHPAKGYGVLDVEKLLKHFEADAVRRGRH